jgi:peptidoglycan-N-acetylglucosamine deacetylase
MPTTTNRRRIGATLAVSIAIHVVALLLVLVNWRLWSVALAMIAANHLVLAVAGLWPRSTLLGPNLRRLPARAVAAGQVALTIDDGPDPQITPQVLELLDRFGGKATFFCIGERVAAHADLAREIVRRGHHIENHTQRHCLHFSALASPAMRREVLQAQATIASVVGESPRYFRAPAGLRNPLLERILRAAGLQLVSWTRRGFDTVTSDPKRVLARLTRNLRAGDILLLHDGHAARTADGSAVILRVLPDLMAAIAAAGLACVTLREAQQNRTEASI